MSPLECVTRDLRKNLLSLRALEVQVCKFSGGGDGITVIKGSMTILRGKQTINLYKIIESIIVGDILAAIEDITRLTHLGHISE